MKQAEFLSKMVNLERAINDLTKALEDELYENGNKLTTDGVDKWMIAYNAVSLAKAMTATKNAISTAHDIAFGE